MQLTADAQGFLTGSKIERSGLAGEMGALANDVRSIRKALLNRRDRDAVATPGASKVAAPERAPATPNARATRIEAPSVMEAHAERTGRGLTGRVASAATEAAKGIVNEESDASVKAMSEVAQPLMRGWAALRGGDTGARQEGWLKRIFNTLRGRAPGEVRGDEATPFERAARRDVAATPQGEDEGRRGWFGRGGKDRPMTLQAIESHLRSIDKATRATVRDAAPRERDAQGRFVRAEPARAGVAETQHVDVAGGGVNAAPVLLSIEAHLRSLDKKAVKQKQSGLIFGALIALAKFGVEWIAWRRDRRMDANLDKIEEYTRRQLEVSHPFYAFVRRRLTAIGEAVEEADTSGRRSWLGALLAPLLLGLGALAAKLAGIPVIGSALAALVRLLGGRVPGGIPGGRRGGRGAPGAPGAGRSTTGPGAPGAGRSTTGPGAPGAGRSTTGPGAPPPVAATPARRAPTRWGRAVEGLRGNRAARTARVAMRNAGRTARVATSAAGRTLAPVGRALTKVPVIGSALALGVGIWGSRAIAKDTTLSGEQKNAAQGRNWGGVGGGLGGAALGAALGTAIAPGVGTVIGGVLGAVLGDWLGGNLGEVIGERFSGFMATLTPAFEAIKAGALGTWDWIRHGASTLFTGVREVFAGVGTWISDRWTALVDTIKGAFETFVGKLGVVLDALRNLPGIGHAIRAAEAAASAAADAGRAVADAARSAAGGAVDAAKGAVGAASGVAGRAWDGARAGLEAMIPAGVRNRVAHQRAAVVASEYKGGNIDGLNDAQTRELVATTVATESRGGQLDARNLGGKGYVGRYQAGASWLADAGLMRGGASAVAAARSKDGYTSDWDWAVSGKMDKFLRNDANWADGMSLQKYLGSAEIQDKAFRDATSVSFRRLRKHKHGLKDGDSPQRIMGALKASHIGGVGGAVAALNGKKWSADANGIGPHKYFNDAAGPNAVFAGMFDRPVAAPALLAAPPAATAPAPATARVAAPAPPVPWATFKIPDAPPVQVPMGSGEKAKPIMLQAPQADAGQDVRDRTIAHIATGGYARA